MPTAYGQRHAASEVIARNECGRLGGVHAGGDSGPELVLDPWLGITLRQLAALVAVAEERSFRRAAVRLGYVQSAVSQQIAGLERVTGQRLVERSRGPGEVLLTVSGHRVCERSRQILAELAAARTAITTL